MKRRRWIALGIVLVLVAAAGAVQLAAGGLEWTFGPSKVWEEEVVTGKGRDRIALIPVEGTISESPGGLWSDTIDFEGILSQLQQAMEDDSVKAVILRINSPGGEVVASDEIYRAIKRVQEQGKPVVASMGGTAASGGYYIATAADWILANPNTLTGSIGVIFTLPNYEGVADLIGYKVNVIQSGAMKDMGNPWREMRPDEKEVFQKLVDETYGRFVDLVAKERGMPREKVLTLADGRIYTGQQAKDLGLVDELGTLDDAFAEAKRLAGLEEAQLIRYVYPSMGWFDLAGGLFGRAREPLTDWKSLLPLPTEPRLMYLFQPSTP
ncbi:MAG: signal peptide peptidase SppA [Bacillota bacterium]|nr:signal peptide peptidase SppA [Bacillota bacterium]